MKDRIITIIDSYLVAHKGEDSPSTEYIAQSLNMPIPATKKILLELADEGKIKVQMIIPEGCKTKKVECWRTIPERVPEPDNDEEQEDEADYGE